MTTDRFRSRFPFALAAGLVLTLAGSALATKAYPVSGTALTVKVGESVKIFLAGSTPGCTFDLTASANVADVVTLNPTAVSDDKFEIVEITGFAVGMTTVTITTMGGTCPMATHTYPVTVIANPVGMAKAYAAALKNALATFKAAAKADVITFANALKERIEGVEGGTLTQTEAQDQAHAASRAFAFSLYSDAVQAVWAGAQAGTTVLTNNAIPIGDAPLGFFPGGLGVWDKFELAIVAEALKARVAYEKISKLFYIGLALQGGPYVNDRLRLVQGSFYPGPLHGSQTTTPSNPLPTQITTSDEVPTTNLAADNGRLLLSGVADGNLGAAVKVTLTKSVVGSPDDVTTQTPDVLLNQWTCTFENLTPGAYSVRVKFNGDSAEVGGVFFIDKK